MLHHFSDPVHSSPKERKCKHHLCRALPKEKMQSSRGMASSHFAPTTCATFYECQARSIVDVFMHIQMGRTPRNLCALHASICHAHVLSILRSRSLGSSQPSVADVKLHCMSALLRTTFHIRVFQRRIASYVWLHLPSYRTKMPHASTCHRAIVAHRAHEAPQANPSFHPPITRTNLVHVDRLCTVPRGEPPHLGWCQPFHNCTGPRRT